MLDVIIRKEFLEKVLTLRFIVAFALSFGLISLSVFVLSNDYTRELANYHASIKLHTEISSQELTYTDRKPSVLSTLFRGIAKSSAGSVRLGVGISPEPIETTDDNPIFALFLPVDLTFIIGVVMSLLAIFFAYDAVCGERERGTLALITSNPVSRPMLILGKWLGGYLSLILSCLIGWLMGLLILLMHPQIQFTLTDWSAMGWILLGALVYLACFFALGVLVSALFSRASIAILVLLFLWIASVFVIPNFSPDLAKVFYQVNSFAIHSRQIKQVENELIQQRQQRHEETALLTIDNRLTWDTVLKLSRDIEKRFYKDKKEKLSELIMDYRRRVQRQEHIATEIACLSPYACFVFFVSQLAAADSGSEAKYIAASEQFDKEYFAKVTLAGKDKVSEKPSFLYSEPTVNERLRSGFVPLFLLLLFTILFLVMGYITFLKSDVRPI